MPVNYFRFAHTPKEVGEEGGVCVASKEIGAVVDGRDTLTWRTDLKLKKNITHHVKI